MNFNGELRVGNRRVGPGNPCFIIAEAGVNHDGNIEKAKRMIDVAVAAGADAVKFQTFTGETLASKDAMLATYHKKGATSEKETLKDLLKRLELNKEEHIALFKYARERGILIFSTPFDEASVDILEELRVDLYKIASFSLTNYPLLRHIASKNKPMIMSTGLHNLGEIEEAVKVIYETGNIQLALLHCTSHYPITPSDSNLRTMQTLRFAFEVPVGYSDHTMGITITLASVAMGANIVEKHYTLNTQAYGVDHDASISPAELYQLVQGIRDIEAAMGTSKKIIPDVEKEIQRVHRPSLVSRVDIPAHTVLTSEMLVIKKPGTGIHPRDLPWVIGKKAKVTIEADRLIKKEDLE
ncbi:TPA: N-acetylneuraminate synthase [Candidatus Woesearchaeota archaeon]|nr:N-acetylneuraminate synthase family protein [Candidatus Woesearchaeota archaeon]HIH12164.1 N-acetylneuraminate synthase [Candidatus Woesearchaeota archaeon]